MFFRRDPTKALQIGLLVLLLISTAQVGYWIIDQSIYTGRVAERLSGLQAADPVAIAEIQRETASRINRYRWEGGFFLLVLIAGMAILTRALRQDEQLRRRQKNFLAAVSHEFKSPLTSLRLAAETLILKKDDPDARRIGQRMLEDIERLMRMVENLLDTTRLEEGRQELHPEAVVLGDVAASSSAEIAPRAASHGIAIHLEIAPELTVTADRAALETMLRNLLDNAFKACVAGAGRRIRVTAAPAGPRLTLEVSDDGVGFPPGDAQLIFEKFYRSGNEMQRATPGTGLGLYIVRRLAELSKARVSARSEGPGTGATVSVSWPR